MLNCPSCARQNADSSRNCSACGTLLVPGHAIGRPRVAVHVVRADGGNEASAILSEEVLTCGQQGNLALPEDPFLAPTQVRFFFMGTRLHAEDVGGGNGTFMRVKGEAALKPGSQLRVGRQRLKLENLPASQPGPEGTVAWGSPIGGALFRLVQVMEGGDTGLARLLGPGTYALGREVGDITFPQDGFISGRHASIEVKDHQHVVIRDLKSSNGTFLRIETRVAVDSEDQFLVGRELIRVEIGA